MIMNKLIEKALTFERKNKGNGRQGSRRRDYSKRTDEIELAIAYTKGEISGQQFNFARGSKSSKQAVVSKIGTILLGALKQGVISIKFNK